MWEVCLRKLALFFFMLLAVSAEQPAKAPAPAEDCTELLMQLSTCMGYLMVGSTNTDPDRICCNGLSNVLGANNGPACLCGAFTNRAGVQLNESRAVSLPADCLITNYPSAANCSSQSKSNVSHSPVAENFPSNDTGASPGSSGSSSIADSVKLLLHTAIIVVVFMY